jgi:predicted ATPase with chaperone activity
MLIKVKGLSKPHGGRFVVEKRKSPHPNREELENEEPARRWEQVANRLKGLRTDQTSRQRSIPSIQAQTKQHQIHKWCEPSSPPQFNSDPNTALLQLLSRPLGHIEGL